MCPRKLALKIRATRFQLTVQRLLGRLLLLLLAQLQLKLLELLSRMLLVALLRRTRLSSLSRERVNRCLRFGQRSSQFINMRAKLLILRVRFF